MSSAIRASLVGQWPISSVTSSFRIRTWSRPIRFRDRRFTLANHLLPCTRTAQPIRHVRGQRPIPYASSVHGLSKRDRQRLSDPRQSVPDAPLPIHKALRTLLGIQRIRRGGLLRQQYHVQVVGVIKLQVGTQQRLSPDDHFLCVFDRLKGYFPEFSI
jgi:hypothetical protein